MLTVDAGYAVSAIFENWPSKCVHTPAHTAAQPEIIETLRILIRWFKSKKKKDLTTEIAPDNERELLNTKIRQAKKRWVVVETITVRSTQALGIDETYL